MDSEQRTVYEHIMAEVKAVGARLVAVSKTKPQQEIASYYALGQRDFGENRVQEVVDKAAALPDDIRWHFIGHLQRNKVKYIAPFVHLIHAVDSWRLLVEINKQAANNERIIDVLLQFHIAEEDSKYGLDLDRARALLAEPGRADLRHVRIVGVMGMATYTDVDEQIASEFEQLKHIFEVLQAEYFVDDASFTEISMGMSGDYPLALERGSTLVRLGSVLFGSRH